MGTRFVGDGLTTGETANRGHPEYCNRTAVTTITSGL